MLNVERCKGWVHCSGTRDLKSKVPGPHHGDLLGDPVAQGLRHRGGAVQCSPQLSPAGGELRRVLPAGRLAMYPTSRLATASLVARGRAAPIEARRSKIFLGQ